MSLRISRDQNFYHFNPNIEPVAFVKPGEEIILETHDCFQGQIRNEKDLVANLDWNHTNPATGPIFINGTYPSTILRIDILDIDVDDQSVMVTIPGEGTVGNRIKDMETTIVKRQGNELVYKENIRLPLAPMIGVIGVAPSEGSIGNGVPGLHGGNMDCTLIKKGARLYLTVQVEGALLGLGDLHAVMGDGEIVAVGAETAGNAKIKTETVDLTGLPTPFLENTESVVTIFSDPDMNRASEGAVNNMLDFLTRFAGLSTNDAAMLMSAAGSLRVCQVVDPAKTVRFEFPKAVLAQIGYQLPE
ncbi:MAG: acetamidase [Anaerolineae bacterium]|nr:acetamidase [Anaerolineae bacterium]